MTLPLHHAPEQGIIVLNDGVTVPYRAIREDDRERLQRFHAGHSERSIYQRFFGYMPQLSDADAAHFTRVDGFDRVALVATDPDDPETLVGVARFDRDPGTNRAEYAAIVTDRWQGRGLGFNLTRALVDIARERGIETLYAIVLPGNWAMLNLLRDLGLARQVSDEDGFERVELDLGSEGPAQ